MNSIAPPFFIFYPETPSFARNVLFTFHRGYFHKSWNAPTAKYSCPQLRTITITRSTHYPSCILLRYHVQPRAYCITFDAICPHFRPTCLFEISNHDPLSFVKFDGTIRLDGILFYHLIFCHFFFFFWPRFMKNHVAPIKHLSCQEHVVRVSNTFFFSYVQSAKYKSWPTTRNHDLECINSELASYYTEVTAIGKSIFLRSISK